MKNSTLRLGSVFFLIGTFHISAQTSLKEKPQKLEVQRHTVMEQYEPALVLSVEERIKLKEERLATIQRRREILDTLNISERRRQRLLKELVRNPFSSKLNKTIADIEFVDSDSEE